MKVFITGATGFIGKHLVKKLLEEGVIVTINLFGNEESPFDQQVSTYKLNENKIESDIDFFRNEKFDGVIHLASLYLTVHLPAQAVKLIDSNVRFSTHVLECAAQAKIKWFINTGTFWQHYENKAYSPVNLYAASKQAFESIAQFYWETKQITFCTLKLSDTFGLNDTRPKIFNLWDKISKTGASLEMSPGNQVIDISFVPDIVEAFVKLSSHVQSIPSTINGKSFAVNASSRYTLKELAQIFEEVSGKKLNIKWGAKPYRENEVMQPWSAGECIPDWRPKYSIQEALNIFINQKDK